MSGYVQTFKVEDNVFWYRWWEILDEYKAIWNKVKDIKKIN